MSESLTTIVNSIRGRLLQQPEAKYVSVPRRWLELLFDSPSSPYADPERAAQVRALAATLIGPLRAVARTHGYALTSHGSLARDIDLVAVPWTPHASIDVVLVEALRAEVERVTGRRAAVDNGARCVDGEWKASPMPEAKPHGRRAWSIQILAAAGAYIDLSVMPTLSEASSI